MLYFIAWSVFLLFIVLSVPIAAMLEKKKNAPEDAAPLDEDVAPLGGGDEAVMADDAATEAGFGDETAAAPVEGMFEDALPQDANPLG
ncbi:MAG: hypothetical protein AAF958_11635 [Planctomycetota bacterium]